MSNDARLTHLADLVRRRAPELTRRRVVAGFDGFIDEMISVVKERQGQSQWTPVPDIGTFGKLITAAAGHSSLREIIVHRTDPGGCSVNLGDGLVALGIALDCFATLGEPRHPAFDPLARQCHSCHSWGGVVGRTLAFEFADGKLMFSAVTQLAEFNPAMLDRMLPDGLYAGACAQAQLIALTDWTLYPHMTECWRRLQTDVFAQLKHRPFFFVDLVDPSGRSAPDIRTMLDCLAGFEAHGPTVLGLNGTEANVVARTLGVPTVEEDLAAVESQASALRAKLGLSQVVIHRVKLAVRADTHGVYGVLGPYCPQPKKLTGAGDRFNAGYSCGLLLNLEPESCLLLGCAASGYFVRQAASANPAQLAEFLDRWAVGACDSN